MPISKRAMLLVVAGMGLAAMAAEEAAAQEPRAAEVIKELGLAESTTALRDTKGWKAPRKIVLTPMGDLAVLQAAAPGAWVRQCGRAPAAASFDAKALLLDLFSARFRRRAAALGVRTNPVFAGAYAFRPDTRFADLFPRFLAGMREGGVIMCHPGVVDAGLKALDPLTTLREREYE